MPFLHGIQHVLINTFEVFLDIAKFLPFLLYFMEIFGAKVFEKNDVLEEHPDTQTEYPHSPRDYPVSSRDNLDALSKCSRFLIGQSRHSIPTSYRTIKTPYLAI